MKIVGIIAAGGTGERLGAAGGKQLLSIHGRPLAAWAADALADAELIQELIIVCNPTRTQEYAEQLSQAITTDKPLTFVAGGKTRADSVYAGLIAAEGADIVAIHDGARPLLDPKDADATIRRLLEDDSADGVVLGTPAVDTIKLVGNSCIIETPDRDAYWQAQTPQVFRRPQLLRVYEQAKQDGYSGTDDASYYERRGGTVIMCPGSRTNLKITTPEDIVLATALLAARTDPRTEAQTDPHTEDRSPGNDS